MLYRLLERLINFREKHMAFKIPFVLVYDVVTSHGQKSSKIV